MTKYRKGRNERHARHCGAIYKTREDESVARALYSSQYNVSVYERDETVISLQAKHEPLLSCARITGDETRMYQVTNPTLPRDLYILEKTKERRKRRKTWRRRERCVMRRSFYDFLKEEDKKETETLYKREKDELTFLQPLQLGLGSIIESFCSRKRRIQFEAMLIAARDVFPLPSHCYPPTNQEEGGTHISDNRKHSKFHPESTLLERGHSPLVIEKTSDSLDTHEISRVLKSTNLSLLYVVSTERGIASHDASRRLARCQSDATQRRREEKGRKERCSAWLEKKVTLSERKREGDG
ncbi:hypothetical protein ALC57_01009 [Trachymyrmex cornetzi]|uniref:Uncharacterized protein n=1 Tax=Trachymyrmex cornetzi TaxID=471704 RepID=A0A151JQN3_9HYME|nr:hypothetical protein ALC57_01009 [Trachymyrmex cornetzi]